jgi:hypothetical protein
MGLPPVGAGHADRAPAPWHAVREGREGQGAELEGLIPEPGCGTPVSSPT